MTRFIRKPSTVDAHKWHKNGDHPMDESVQIPDGQGGHFLSEGKVVRRFRHPELDGDGLCPYCNRKFDDHGWIEDHSLDGRRVCPGDWIFPEPNGVGFYPVKPSAVRDLYDCHDPNIIV